MKKTYTEGMLSCLDYKDYIYWNVAEYLYNDDFAYGLMFTIEPDPYDRATKEDARRVISALLRRGISKTPHGVKFTIDNVQQALLREKGKWIALEGGQQSWDEWFSQSVTGEDHHDLYAEMRELPTRFFVNSFGYGEWK